MRAQKIPEGTDVFMQHYLLASVCRANSGPLGKLREWRLNQEQI
jgi:hypothetical protein